MNFYVSQNLCKLPGSVHSGSAANPPLAYSEFPPDSPQFMQGRDSKWSLPIYCPQTTHDLKFLYIAFQLSLFQS